MPHHIATYAQTLVVQSLDHKKYCCGNMYRAPTYIANVSKGCRVMHHPDRDYSHVFQRYDQYLADYLWQTRLLLSYADPDEADALMRLARPPGGTPGLLTFELQAS